MIEERFRELIHAEIDGELTDRQKAELANHLLAHPETRTIRDEIGRVCAALDGIEMVEPPHGLRDSILRALQLPAGEIGAGVGSGVRSLFGRGSARGPFAIRYAAAVLIALVVAAVAFQVGLESRDGLEVSQLVGTMAGSNDSTTARLADTARVDLRELQGTVRLYDAGGVLVLDFDLAAQHPVNVVAAYAGREVRFSGFVEPGSGENRRYALSLAGPVEPGAAVRLGFYSKGILIHEDALEVAGMR